ncbi:phage tail sheath family protein [Streptomyces liliifuscus]|uniref:Phage tail sheath family protein n=1 Tax=Streptomyces liliifuscus TaxID=2797636 RepID=A0A7T7L179_9ACTN|nr:phage tail sheath subtilisin-like domain-containing protein [Streptomyces liliifuscus]QQM44585.1 phage tail sheath family protein [Streptomyces liliifuscus]
MSLNIGINVVETDGRTAPAISGAPTSVAGLVLRSRRGPVDSVVRVSSVQQFAGRFGGYDARFLGAYAVDGFFGNGGRQAYVARVVGAGAAAASVTLKDRDGDDSLAVGAGYRGTPDPGAWGNDLHIAVADNPEFSTPLTATLDGNRPPRLQGEAWAARTVDLSPDDSGATRRLVLRVEAPAATLTVTFGNDSVPVPAQVTVDDVAAAVNNQAGTRVRAEAAGGGLLLIGRGKGGTAKLSVLTGADGDDETRELLGFPDGTVSASGTNSANPSYTSARVATMAGFRVGDRVRLDDGIASDWVRITAIEQAGPADYVLTWDEPAAAGDRNEYRVEDRATVSTCEFDLVVRRGAAADGPGLQTIETWTKLSLDASRPNYAPTKVNDPRAGSASIVLTDPSPGDFTGRDVPAVTPGVRLGLPTPDSGGLTRTEGADGDDPTAGDYRAALTRFDTSAIQLLSVPEAMADALMRPVTQAALNYCEARGDAMFVGHTPKGQDSDGARGFGQDFRAAKVYGALYWPWITVSDPLGAGAAPTRVVPPTGHVLGVYARIDQTRGVWKAPAGDEAVLRGALAVERDVTDTDNTELVKNGSVNSVRAVRGAGIVVDTSRTLSTDTRWLFVGVRLLFNYVKSSLREGLRWVKQEPNRDTLWNKVKYNSVTPFLMRLHQARAFGSGRPEDVFTVVCGPENNPPDEVALGNLRIEVYFYPSSPAETILVMVGQQDSGASASEN